MELRNSTIIAQDNLISIDMSSLEINSFPPEFSFPSTTAIINLYNNKITSIPNSIFRGLDNLVNLKLRKNYLRELPEELFQDCKSLTFIDLSLNCLDRLPPKIFYNVPELKDLNLEANQLQTLDDDFFVNNHKLETLSIASNSLASLPESLLDTPLKRLNLVNNPELRNIAKKYITSLQVKKILRSLS